MHGPTFMANPLACAVALASLELLGDGRWLAGRGRRASSAGCAPGWSPAGSCRACATCGSWARSAWSSSTTTVDVPAATAAAVERGVWLRPFRDLVYTMPPYVIGEDDLARGDGGDRGRGSVLIRFGL